MRVYVFCEGIFSTTGHVAQDDYNVNRSHFQESNALCGMNLTLRTKKTQNKIRSTYKTKKLEHKIAVCESSTTTLQLYDYMYTYPCTCLATCNITAVCIDTPKVALN